MQKIFFDKNHWFQLVSTKNDWIISLFLISIALHSRITSQPFHHVFFLLAKRQPLNFGENFIANPHKVTLREKILFLAFLFVFLSFFGLLRPLLQICKVWLTQTPAECTNQVTA